MMKDTREVHGTVSILRLGATDTSLRDTQSVTDENDAGTPVEPL